MSPGHTTNEFFQEQRSGDRASTPTADVLTAVFIRMRPLLILFSKCKPCLIRAATVRERLRGRVLTRTAQYLGTHASANRSKHHPWTHADQASAPVRFDDLRIEQFRPWHPPWLRC